MNTLLCSSPPRHPAAHWDMGHKESRKVLTGFNQNRSGGYFLNDPNTASLLNMWSCEIHVLYTPSCSKIQARYITLHLSCQTHWTHADFGSTEVVQCISNKMPHSFGIHQSTDNSKDESILESPLPEPLCTISISLFKMFNVCSTRTVCLV